MPIYDLVVIGCGWAGFNAALLAKKLGKSVCVIEKDQIGGTCLNRGCIPTKVLTHFAKENKGVEGLSLFKKEELDTILKLKGGMSFVIKSSGIDFIKGEAKVISSDTVLIKDGNKEIKTKFILLAAGSTPKELPFLQFDHKKILSSDDILYIDELPKNILIVGGGVIGCEFACALNRLGSKVTLVEVLDRLVAIFDRDVSKKIEQALIKSGVIVKIGFNVKELDLNTFDKVLVSVGRKFDVTGLIDSKVPLDMDNGYIKVDKYLNTSIPSIYAAGDCIGGLQLAHVASHEGRLAVKNMFGEKDEVDYSAIPSSVFTSPELAQVGINEDTAKSKSMDIKVLKRLFSTIGMAHIQKETDGFMKLIIDNKSSIIIGASIVGPIATELVNTVTIAIKYKLTVKQLDDLVFAHPSISEIFTETIQS